jgi:hypothetical protein
VRLPDALSFMKKSRGQGAAYVEQRRRELLVAPRPELSYVGEGGEHGVGVLIAAIATFTACTFRIHGSWCLGRGRSEPSVLRSARNLRRRRAVEKVRGVRGVVDERKRFCETPLFDHTSHWPAPSSEVPTHDAVEAQGGEGGEGER